MPSLSERLKARTLDNSPSHPANNTARIDTATLNGRIRYTFGTIINAKLPDGVKDTKLAKGMRMLWPHMSKDIEHVPQESLYRAAMFVNLMMQMCIAGCPIEGMSFEDYVEGVMEGRIRILPGQASLIPAPEDESVTA